MGSRFVRVAAAAAFAAALVSAGPAGAVPVDRGLEYVNLGDSFSAASGVSPVVPGSHPSCQQSERNFAHIVAAERGHRLTDVSCGGAKTEHFTTAQYEGLRPQLDALNPSTELVTLTIGGNNNDTFAGAVASCIGAAVTGLGQWDPCRQQYGDSLAEPVLDRTYPAVTEALRAIHERSPRAEVLIVGYPWLLPAAGSCPLQMPMAPGDVSYLRELQTTLNDAIRRAAEDTDSTFVDMSGVSEGRDACQPVDRRWIEPLIGATQPVPVHPNAAGEQAMAAAVLDAIDAD